MVAYNGKQCILDLSLINSLLTFSIWMCHFDSEVSLGVELDNQAFDLLGNAPLLLSVVSLSIRSFFTI